MRKYKFEDDRTPEEIQSTMGFVIATDKFMSGWGKAPGKSVVATPFVSEEDKKLVMSRLEKRTEMKRIRVVYGNDYRPSLSSMDHLHIYNTSVSFRYPLT